ncbi:hypothetical protein [Streptococcus pluranimalium]|uniref:hypothetical protein n=1 Tax=Streptococcus pluranimalium TaxID=82348 RepID=UPI003F68DB6B
MSLVKAEEATGDAITQPIQGFMVTVTVLGENGKTLAGQKVMLYDITSGRVDMQVVLVILQVRSFLIIFL